VKISRDARNQARKLFQVCAPGGKLDPERTRAVVASLAKDKPRGYLPVLFRLRKLVELAIEQDSIEVESAVELPDKAESVFQSLEGRYGPALEKDYRVTPELIGGMRIRRGSDVWDGSVQARLSELKRQLHTNRH